MHLTQRGALKSSVQLERVSLPSLYSPQQKRLRYHFLWETVLFSSTYTFMLISRGRHGALYDSVCGRDAPT